MAAPPKARDWKNRNAPSRKNQTMNRTLGPRLKALWELGDPVALQNAVAVPAAASPANILALQRSYGNDAVTGLVQAKLAVGPAGDRYEQEADRMAEQAMNVPDPVMDQRSVVGDRHGVLRQVEEKIHDKRPASHRTGGGYPVAHHLESRLNNQKGGGSSLPDDVRHFMEPRFGADFSAVRVHTDSQAVQLNRELYAQAFTHGQDIYFGAGRYSPDGMEGKRLLAHELTHVVQQNGRGNQIQRRVALAKDKEGDPDFVELTSIDYALQEAGGPVQLLKHSNLSQMGKDDVLFIVGHGAPGAIKAGTTKKGKAIWYSANKIAQMLFKGKRALKGPIKAIRFTSCYAGTGKTDDLTDSIVGKIHGILGAKQWRGVQVSGARGPSIKSAALGKAFTVVDPQKGSDVRKIQKALEKIHEPRTKTQQKIRQQEAYIGRPLTLAEKGAIANAITADFYRDFVQALQDPQGAAQALQQKAPLTKDAKALLALLQGVSGSLTLQQAMTELVSE